MVPKEDKKVMPRKVTKSSNARLKRRIAKYRVYPGTTPYQQVNARWQKLCCQRRAVYSALEQAAKKLESEKEPLRV